MPGSGIYAEKWYPEKRHVPYRFICIEKQPGFELFSVSRQVFIAVLVWKFWIDYHLKLSLVRELGYSRFLTIIDTNVKIDIK